jgi:broad specificity phosphatase PhoE
MSGRPLRLVLLCHAATSATRRATFAGDEAAEAAGLAAAEGLAGRLRARRVFARRVLASPARCALQTAAALGLEAVAEPALRDCDWGRWRGRSLEAVGAAEPEAVAAWLADPEAAPHGGESVAALIGRVGGWMEAEPPGRTLAVTHPAVIRAATTYALGAPAACFWRVDVAPLALVELSRSGARWSLRASGV